MFAFFSLIAVPEPDKKRTPAILNRSDVDSSIERELGYWLKEIPADDKNRVKDLIFNNLQILTNYSPQGKDKCEDSCVGRAKHGRNG